MNLKLKEAVIVVEIFFGDSYIILWKGLIFVKSTNLEQSLVIMVKSSKVLRQGRFLIKISNRQRDGFLMIRFDLNPNKCMLLLKFYNLVTTTQPVWDVLSRKYC